MLITQAEAGRRLCMTRQSLYEIRKKNPMPSFFILDGKGRIRVDDENPEWKKLEAQKNLTTVERLAANKARRDGALLAEEIRNKKNRAKEFEKAEKAEREAREKWEEIKSGRPKPPRLTKKQKEKEAKIADADARVVEAQRQTIIHKAKISEEKAKQEEIKTLELKGELAPIALIKHFFSFSENLIQRLYRRPPEISPEISAMYLAGDDKKAVNKIIRELEAIVKDVVNELREEIRKEGYKKQ